MKLWRVDDVMTTSVISVDEQMPYREIAAVLVDNRVSAVPVVTRSGEVVGVVSEADLALRVEAAGQPLRRPRLTRRRRSEQRKAVGRTAADLMTSPAVVVARSLSLAVAARRMHRAGVKRMPVVGATGQLAGIVTRGDLLRADLLPGRASDHARSSAFPSTTAETGSRGVGRLRPAAGTAVANRTTR